MLEALRFAVHRDSCTDRVIPKQQPLDGDGGVVYVFLALGTLNIAHLTAIAIDAIAHAIDKIIALAADFYRGQIAKIPIERHHGAVVLG